MQTPSSSAPAAIRPPGCNTSPPKTKQKKADTCIQHLHQGQTCDNWYIYTGIQQCTDTHTNTTQTPQKPAKHKPRKRKKETNTQNAHSNMCRKPQTTSPAALRVCALSTTTVISTDRHIDTQHTQCPNMRILRPKRDTLWSLSVFTHSCVFTL